MNVELSLAALDTLWEDLRLGRVPFPLEVRSHGDTLDSRAEIKRAGYADLERRGLARAGRAEPPLTDALHLLAHPSVGIDLVALLDMADTVPLKAVAVTRGRLGLLAVQGKQTVRLTTVRNTAIAGSVVELLPHTRAAPGDSVTQPAAALRSNVTMYGRAKPNGVLRSNAGARRAVAAVMERPALRAGQFGVTLTDDAGKRRRPPGIAWFDTDAGRYATTTTRGQDGDDWITLWPADNARLIHRLGETIARG